MEAAPQIPSFSELSKKWLCVGRGPHLGRANVAPGRWVLAAPPQAWPFRTWDMADENCWYCTRKADMCPIVDGYYCIWWPPMCSPAPFCFRDCCRERHTVYPAQHGKDTVLHLLTRNGSWRKNYREPAHSLKLRAVATADICRDSARNAVCAPHIKTKKYLSLKKCLILYIVCTTWKTSAMQDTFRSC